MRLVVTIPAFNEAENIRRVITSIPRHVHGCSEVLVIVIDDGSVDETAKVAKEAGADHVYKHSINSGVVYAFKNGIQQALALGADVIVNIDADGQFNPLEIPKLVSPIVEGKTDVVLGSRFIDSSYHRVPQVKRMGNLIISLIVSVLSGQRIRDTQCGYRALSRQAAKGVKLSGLFTYTQEMILGLSFKRKKMLEIPISVKYFQGRKSRVVKNISKYTFKVIGVLLTSLIRRFGPAVLAFLLAISALVVGLSISF